MNKIVKTYLTLSLMMVAFLAPSNVFAGEESIAIPLSSYNKLLNRMDRIESRLDSIPTQTGTPSDSTGYYGSLEVTLFTIFQANNTAGVVNDSNLVDFDDNSVNIEFGPEVDVGARLEVGYVPQQGLGWAARFWHFNSGNGENVSYQDEDVVANWFDDPDIAIDGDTDENLLADRDVEFNTAAVEATSTHGLGGATVKLSGGLRFFNSNMNGFWRDPDEDDGEFDDAVRIDNNFVGAGPVLGVNVVKPIVKKDNLHINLFGGIRTSAVFGSGTTLIRNIDDTDVDGVEVDKARMVYSTEIELGVNGTWNPGAAWEIFYSAALEAQHHANIGNIASAYTDSDDAEEGSHIFTGDMSLLGGVFSVGVRRPF
ncbi:MAG: hypothetical protein ACQ9MH_24865 [Nitrospinales bacterium]